MKRTLLLLAFLNLATGALAQDSVTFATQIYPPFSSQEADGSYRGIAVDQIETIMRDIDAPYELVIRPWPRAMALAEERPMHCVFAAARTPEREPNFKWVGPLHIDRNFLVRHAGSAVTAKTIEEAKAYTIGTHRSGYTEVLLRNLGFPKIDLNAEGDTTLRKLLSDRIDMITMSESTYEKIKAEGAPVDKVLILSEQPLGIACNKKVPDALIDRMQAALDRRIKDGTQQAILRRYDPSAPR